MNKSTKMWLPDMIKSLHCNIDDNTLERLDKLFHGIDIAPKDFEEILCNSEHINKYICMVNLNLEKSKEFPSKENFENSVAMLNDMGVGINEITVVTNDFHEYRAYEFAKRCGITAYSYPSKTPWNGYMPFATREVFAVVYQIFLN